MSHFKGKTVVITGGNSGIGFSTAQLFKAKEANVIIIGRSEEKVKEASNQIGATGIVADVTDLKALKEASNQVKEQFGKIDVLFVNAGVFFGAPIGQTSEDLFDNQVNINFKGAVFTVEYFLPLLNHGGSIIGLSSVLANAGLGTSAIYSATKSALNTYLKTAVGELADRKIRVNIVNPGPISTPIYGKTGMAEDQLNGFAQALQSKVPLQTFGTPEEVAKLVTFIASDDASFINGAEIDIDGGLNVHSIL